MPVGAVEAGKLNVVFSGIRPVDSVIYEVQGQSIGPRDLILDDDASVGAVHPNSPNVRVVPPVRPIQVPNQQGGKDAVRASVVTLKYICLKRNSWMRMF